LDVKYLDSIEGMYPKLIDLRQGEASGTCGVGVKSVDITGNANGEDSLLVLS